MRAVEQAVQFSQEIEDAIDACLPTCLEKTDLQCGKQSIVSYLLVLTLIVHQSLIHAAIH